MAADEAVKALQKEITPDKIRELVNEILSQFALDKESNYQGIYPMAVVAIEELYPVLKEARAFLHNMVVLQVQLMNYLATLGSDLATATSVVGDISKGLEGFASYVASNWGIK